MKLNDFDFPRLWIKDVATSKPNETKLNPRQFFT